MLRRHYSYYQPVCDYCAKALPAELSGKEAISAALAAGWELRRSGKYWLLVCAGCIFEEKYGKSTD